MPAIRAGSCQAICGSYRGAYRRAICLLTVGHGFSPGCPGVRAAARLPRNGYAARVLLFFAELFEGGELALDGVREREWVGGLVLCAQVV